MADFPLDIPFSASEPASHSTGYLSEAADKSARNDRGSTGREQFASAEL